MSCMSRYGNPPSKELLIAAGEQMKITELRLRQLWEGKQTAAARRTGRVLAHVQGAALWLAPPYNILHDHQNLSSASAKVLSDCK